jgi:hypothetical protein
VLGGEKTIMSTVRLESKNDSLMRQAGGRHRGLGVSDDLACPPPWHRLATKELNLRFAWAVRRVVE